MEGTVWDVPDPAILFKLPNETSDQAATKNKIARTIDSRLREFSKPVSPYSFYPQLR